MNSINNPNKKEFPGVKSKVTYIDDQVILTEITSSDDDNKSYKKAVLSQGKPREAAVNFDTYQISQWHRAVPLPLHGFLVDICLQTTDNAGLLSKFFEEAATEIAKKCQLHCRLTPTLRNPREYPHIGLPNISRN